MSSNKQWTLEKREQRIKHLLSSGADPDHIHQAAEDIRMAQLAILKKSESEIYPEESNKGNLLNIEQERQKWLSMSVAEIIARYK